MRSLVLARSPAAKNVGNGGKIGGKKSELLAEDVRAPLAFTNRPAMDGYSVCCSFMCCD